MIRQSLATLALLPGLIFAGQASALTITTGGIDATDGSGLTTSVDGAIIETFDHVNGSNGGLVQPWSWETTDTDLHIVQGSEPGHYAAPFGNETHYLSINQSVPGSATVGFGNTYDYLGLYWGSVDTYNTLELLLGGNIVETITGSMALNPANGDQGEGGSTYINITDVQFDGARFHSTQFAFEFDNLAVANLDPPFQVSEPATLALFGIGLIGLGFFAQRRMRSAEGSLDA